MKRLRHEFEGLTITPLGIFLALCTTFAIIGLAVGLLLADKFGHDCTAVRDTAVAWQITHYCGTGAGQ